MHLYTAHVVDAVHLCTAHVVYTVHLCVARNEGTKTVNITGRRSTSWVVL